jgi:hypothetical protein
VLREREEADRKRVFVWRNAAIGIANLHSITLASTRAAQRNFVRRGLQLTQLTACFVQALLQNVSGLRRVNTRFMPGKLCHNRRGAGGLGGEGGCGREHGRCLPVSTRNIDPGAILLFASEANCVRNAR